MWRLSLFKLENVTVFPDSMHILQTWQSSVWRWFVLICSFNSFSVSNSTLQLRYPHISFDVISQPDCRHDIKIMLRMRMTRLCVYIRCLIKHMVTCNTCPKKNHKLCFKKCVSFQMFSLFLLFLWHTKIKSYNILCVFGRVVDILNIVYLPHTPHRKATKYSQQHVSGRKCWVWLWADMGRPGWARLAFGEKLSRRWADDEQTMSRRWAEDEHN